MGRVPAYHPSAPQYWGIPSSKMRYSHHILSTFYYIKAKSPILHEPQHSKLMTKKF